MLAFFRNEMGFGGNNGLTDFKDMLGFDLQSDATRVGLFVASALALALGYLACRVIVDLAPGPGDGRHPRRGGRAPVSSATGWSGSRLAIFTFSAVLAGMAGALYVPQVGIINPGEFSPLNSIEIVIWVAVGGRATLYGAVVGAVLVNYAQEHLHRRLPGRLAVRPGRTVRPGDPAPAARLVGCCVIRGARKRARTG